MISSKVRPGAVVLVEEVFSCACARGGARCGCEILRYDFAISEIDLRQEVVSVALMVIVTVSVCETLWATALSKT